MGVAVALGLLIALAIILVLAVVRSLIIICPPNRIAVISGRNRTLTDGRTVGYRVVKGGRTLRIPILERVSWVELNSMPIDVSVHNAFSKGAIPLNVQGIANVKVSSNEGLLQNSVERFLGREPEYIAQIAKETLEANLRGVLATLTPEEVNEDRLKFSQQLVEEADDDVKTLGLELDVLKIQNVTDEVGYLESVGRKQTAEVIKTARVAEAEREAESLEAEALSRRRAEIAAAQADLDIAEEQNTLRVRSAELEAVAAAEEARALVSGEKAKVVAEQSLESERVELQQRRLEADVVAPARAKLEAEKLLAEAEAAQIVEDGAASVEVFQRTVDAYKSAGPDAQRVFVLTILPELVEKIVSVVDNVDIDKVSVIDSGGQGTGIPGVLGQLPMSIINLAEQLGTATGVDILGSLRDDSPPAPVSAASGNGSVIEASTVEAGGDTADGDEAEQSTSDDAAEAARREAERTAEQRAAAAEAARRKAQDKAAADRAAAQQKAVAADAAAMRQKAVQQARADILAAELDAPRVDGPELESRGQTGPPPPRRAE